MRARMLPTVLMTAMLVYGLLTAIAVPAKQPDKVIAKAMVIPAAEIKWQDGPPSLPKGATIAILEGNPNKEGPYVFRIKLPDGYRVQPHTHPHAERVTVLAGSFNI